MRENPIYLALDMPDLTEAERLIDEAGEFVGGLKIGLTFWYANMDEAIVRRIVRGKNWFLDAKMHDIPTQVGGAIRAVMALQPSYVSMHAGEMRPNASPEQREQEDAMMKAAVEAADEHAAKTGLRRPKLLGVTTLTHLNATPTEVVAKGHRIMMCGLDGVISSPLELTSLRSELGRKPILVTPGIRVSGPVSRDEQRRTMSARQANAAGADIIVVGRPITEAASPHYAAKAILESLSHAD